MRHVKDFLSDRLPPKFALHFLSIVFKMKLSFARKEDEALLFTASSSSSSFPKDGGGNILAIGLCDVAGAGVRALKSLTISRESGGKQLKRRDFELKFTDENGGDLVGKMIGNKNGEKEADEEEEEDCLLYTSPSPRDQ